MITAVLDANVLASGLVGLLKSNNTPGRILRAWRSGLFSLSVSLWILLELEHTLAKDYFRQHLTADDISEGFGWLHHDATLTPITIEVHGVATHPEDDLVLATALSAGAQYLVTGDVQLQRLGSYEGVTILSPRAFLDILEAQPAEA